MKPHPFRNHPQTPTMFLENPRLQVQILVGTKKVRASTFFVIGLATFFIMFFIGNANGEPANCLSPVKSLDQKRKEVDAAGGIWGVFARSSALDNHSKDAVKLDSNISQLIETLVYLCETKSGVPFNELALFVTRKIHELGEEPFKREQIFLGKPKKYVEEWLKYSKIAEANNKRALDTDKIKTSIQGASIFINKYWNLFHDFNNRDEVHAILPATVALNQEIIDFMRSDPYTAQALFENSQIPFWDIDENYGGS